MDLKIVANRLSENKLKIETVLASLVVISLLLLYAGQSAARTLVMLTMTTLATFYFLSNYVTTELAGLFGSVMNKTTAIGSSVAVIGILFSVMKLSGSREMVIIGAIAMVTCGLGLAYVFLSNRDKKLIPLIVRIIVLGTLCAILLSVSGPPVEGR